MKIYSNTERKILKLEAENAMLNEMLSIRKQKIDFLSLMTESVNKNFSAAAIISLIDNNLKEKLIIGNDWKWEE